MSLRELAVLDLLRVDRDECGVGVLCGDVARVGGTRWPEGVVHRLRAHGFVIGERAGRFQLGHDEPVVVSTGVSAAGRPSGEGRVAGAPVDTVLRLFELGGRAA